MHFIFEFVFAIRRRGQSVHPGAGGTPVCREACARLEEAQARWFSEFVLGGWYDAAEYEWLRIARQDSEGDGTGTHAEIEEGDEVRFDEFGHEDANEYLAGWGAFDSTVWGLGKISERRKKNEARKAIQDPTCLSSSPPRPTFAKTQAPPSKNPRAASPPEARNKANAPTFSGTPNKPQHHSVLSWWLQRFRWPQQRKRCNIETAAFSAI
jgi:hypothetical protein